MNRKDIAVLIPARFHSSRLPGKPLIKIGNKTLIEHVWSKVIKAHQIEDCYVLTDSLKILKFCQEKDINVLMTPSNCLTGTDRIYEFSKVKKYKYYINVQGDEIFIKPLSINKIISNINNKIDVLNGYCLIKNRKDFFNLNIPKVIIDQFSNLLYMSRAPIPINKSSNPRFGLKQVCIYGFSYKSLQIFGKRRKKMLFENIEDIEILRFVELGIKVKMIKLPSTILSIDTKDDLINAKKIIKRSNK